MGKSLGHPRPIELRFRLDAEYGFLETPKGRLGLAILRVALRVFGWRADLFIWDSRKHLGYCPCWNAATRQENDGFIVNTMSGIGATK
jgi:hypothetical protein